MKNILKYFIVGGAAVTMLSSCDLNLLPTTSIAYEEGSELFLNENDVAAFQNGVMASYRALQYGVYTQTTEVQCDGFNATIDYGNNYGAVHRCDNSFTPGEYDTEDMWENHYYAIKNYNIAIANADNVNEDLKASTKVLKGIALFCRASSYLTLARHFGNAYDPATASSDLSVPLVLKYDQLEKPARATVKAVYDQIIADLDEAEVLLSEAAAAGITITVQTNKVNLAGQVRAGVPTVDAVKALKARYYLDVQDYENAAAAAESVLSSAAGYKLAATPEEMVAEYTNDAGTEPIIQLFASMTEGVVGNTIFTQVGNDDKVGKYFSPYFIPSSLLVNAYDATDLRFSNWFTDSLYPVKMSGSYYDGVYVFTKYLDNPGLHSGTLETGAHAAKPLLISEMYLIAAEAYAQSGNSDAAQSVLNQLQAARKAVNTTGSLENVKKEWFRETVGEGLRLACIKRWGDGLAVRAEQSGVQNIIMTGEYYNQRALSADSHYLNWPVPSYEIKLNANLVQNPGYTAE